MELLAIKELLASYELKDGITATITTCPRYGSHTVTLRRPCGQLVSRYPDYQDDFEFCLTQDLKFYGVKVAPVAVDIPANTEKLKMGLMRCDFATDRAYRVYKCAVKVYLIRTLWRFRCDPKIRRAIRSHVIRLRDHRIGLLMAKKALDESAAKIAQDFINTPVKSPVVATCFNKRGDKVYLTAAGFWHHDIKEAMVFTAIPPLSDPMSFYNTLITYEDVK